MNNDKITVFVEGLGTLYVEPSWQGNTFTVKGIPEYQKVTRYSVEPFERFQNCNVISIWFNFAIGKWAYSTYSYDKVDPLNHKQIQKIGSAILENPTCKNKFDKYVKDAKKRLEKSVPRLKEEYETASDQLSTMVKMGY